ncbi:MAG: hypothetical protein EOM50_03590 [Erysipelotrichia bacterium]|nr:hypothetical protein [Erysipelotrichia bacterium]NCC54466.1 hypothetical protein [Erysipelotrichia bacterium]
MAEKNLAALLKKLETDDDLAQIGKLDDKTKEILQKMADNEIDGDKAIEIFLRDKENYKK